VSLTARPSPAIEEILYFCASELVANAAKHSGGSAITIALTQDSDLLRLTVADDGDGGAVMTGSGLTGLAVRLSAVDGCLKVTSPLGGPTVLHVDVPTKP
jgi:signal transduction histidine kinase